MNIDQQYTNQKINPNDEMSLIELVSKTKNFFSFLKSRWVPILSSMILGSSIGLLISYFDKPTYKAVLTFAMEEEKGGGVSGALGLASSFGIDLGGTGVGGAFASGNLAELMKSRLIVEKVLLEPQMINSKVTTLAEYFIEVNKLREEWPANSNLKNLHFKPKQNRHLFTLQQDSILKQIHKKLIDNDCLNIMQKDKKVTILSIEVKSENELFSKLFCENLAKETSDFYVETKSKKARLNVNVLQRQVDSVRNELNGAINVVAKETDNVYNLNPAFNIKGAPSKKKQIDVQANTAILTNLVVQLELAKITLRKETPLIQLIDMPIFPLEKNKLGKFKSLIFGGILVGLVFIIYLVIIDLFRKIVSNK